MNKKIITIDIIVMSVIVLFLLIWIATTRLKSTQYGYYLLALFRVPYYGYYLFLMYIYTFIKCILGIIIIIKKILNKDRIIRSKIYLLCLLPMIIMVISYIYLIYIVRGFDYNLNLLSISLSRGFNYWFPAMNINIILCFIIIFGIMTWLINLILYEKSINKFELILINVITPVSILILYFEILLQFSK
jgi:hypothetical protein